MVHPGITYDKRESIGQFEASLAEDLPLPQARRAQRGLMDHLECKARLGATGGLAGPAAEQVPGSQSQVFGDEKPQADQVAKDFVGEKLSHATFHARGVTGFDAGTFPSARRLDGQFTLRPSSVEFFFEGRSLQSRVAHSGC